MELNVDKPKFKISEFRGFANPFTKEGMGGLAIVLGAIVVISSIVYAGNLGNRTEPAVLPAKTEAEVTAAPERAVSTEIPTIIPLTEEEGLPPSPSPTGEVRQPTGTLTPVVKGVTVTPTPIL